MNQDIQKAVQRAKDTVASADAAWQPVFVDVLSKGVKVAHLASDGYTHEHWSFYPISEKRSQQVSRWGEEKKSGHRVIRHKFFDNVIPKWVTCQSFGKAKTFSEREAAR